MGASPHLELKRKEFTWTHQQEKLEDILALHDSILQNMVYLTNPLQNTHQSTRIYVLLSKEKYIVFSNYMWKLVSLDSICLIRDIEHIFILQASFCHVKCYG